MIERFPLCWPVGYSRTQRPLTSRFKTSFAKARDHCINEIKLFGGLDVIISSNVPLRQDGLPYANFTKLEDTGVAVYFTYEGQQVVYACDRWIKAEDNMYAVARTIAATRQQERDGCSDLLKRTFTGFKALEAPTEKKWWVVLQVDEHCTKETMEASFRSLASKYHPDRQGGSTTMYQELSLAYVQAKKHFKKD